MDAVVARGWCGRVTAPVTPVTALDALDTHRPTASDGSGRSRPIQGVPFPCSGSHPPWYALVAVLAVAGCEITASIGRDQLPGTSSDTGEADPSSSTGDTAPSTESDGDTLAGEGEGEGGFEGEGTSGPGPADHDGDESTGGAHRTACEASATDSACAHCRKAECCGELQACHDTDGCYPLWDCIVAGEHSEAACRDLFAGHDAFDAMLACTGSSCDASCEAPTDDAPFD